MNISDLSRVIRKRWKVIVGVMILAVVAVGAIDFTSTKQYQATSQVFVSVNQTAETNSSLVASNSFAAQRVQSYTEVATSTDFAALVLADKAAPLKTGLTAQQLSKRITATAPSGRVLIDLTVTDSSPQRAADLANAVAAEFVGKIADIEKLPLSPDVKASLSAAASVAAASAAAASSAAAAATAAPPAAATTAADGSTPTPTAAAPTSAPATSAAASPTPSASASGPSLPPVDQLNYAYPVSLQVTQSALVPSGPVSPKPVRDLLLAVVGGLLLGFVVAFVREALENTFKNAEALARGTDVPVLGEIPLDKRVARSPIAFRGDPHDGRSEAIRQLRTNLQFVNVDHAPKVIAVTSALPGEGKTHAALNLAAAYAEAGRRVCLIECDLRKPTVATLLGLVKDVGLTTVLIGQAEVEDVLQNAGSNLAVMTSGQIPPNPTELLTSEQFRSLVSIVADYVDVVVLDTAPLLPVADGAVVASQSDIALLVVRAGKTRHEVVRRAIEALTKVGRPPTGTVLSMAGQRGEGGYSYYYGEYRPRDSAERPAKRAAALSDEEAARVAAGVDHALAADEPHADDATLTPPAAHAAPDDADSPEPAGVGEDAPAGRAR